MNQIKRWAQTHLLEIVSALVAFVVFFGVSDGMVWHQSGAPHFVYQADAWLHGRLWIENPPNQNDWVKANGHWYVSFPPFPAVLMMPFVALNGLAFNDVFFTVCLASINVGLFAFTLKQFRAAGEHSRTDREIAWLTAFWAFGSVYFYTSIRGEVWFTAHVTSVTLALIYLCASLRARLPILAGIAFGCAAITRASLVYAFPFFLLECIAPEGSLQPAKLAEHFKTSFPKLLRFGVSGAIVLGFAFWMNYARFGNPTEFGHDLLFNNRVNADVKQWGLFNLHYLPRNLNAAFLLLPKVTWDPFTLGFDGHGMSMFLTTPLLLVVPFIKTKARTLLALAVTAAVLALPGLFYMNDGWYQFGFRFSNDYLLYLFLILIVSGRRMNAGFYALGVAGIVVSTWGAFVFGRS